MTLGVPNIRDGRHDSYTVTIRMQSEDDAAGPVLRTGARWYAGDLHSHSGHSDGRTVLASGTRIPVPDRKMKWDEGNPTGHGILFIGTQGQIYCYIAPGGV